MNETLVVVETFTTDTVSAVQDMLSRGQSLAYIVAALLFILALAGLSKQKSAMRGNVLGIIGMVVALAIVIVATTIEGFQFPAYTVGLILVAMLIRAAIGVWKARRVQMTAYARTGGIAPFVRWCRRGARRHQLLPHDPWRWLLRWCLPYGRSGHCGVHRCGHLHGFDHRELEAFRAHFGQATHVFQGAICSTSSWSSFASCASAGSWLPKE